MSSFSMKILERNARIRENKIFIKEDFLGVTGLGTNLKKYQQTFINELITSLKRNYETLPEDLKSKVKEEELIRVSFEEEMNEFEIKYFFEKNELNDVERFVTFEVMLENDKFKINIKQSDEEFFKVSEISELINSYNGMEYSLSDFGNFINEISQFNRDIAYLYLNYLKEFKAGDKSLKYKEDILKSFMDYFFETMNKEIFVTTIYNDNIHVDINDKTNSITLTISTPDKLNKIILDYVYSPEKDKFVQINTVTNFIKPEIFKFKDLDISNTIDFVSVLKKDLGKISRSSLNPLRKKSRNTRKKRTKAKSRSN